MINLYKILSDDAHDKLINILDNINGSKIIIIDANLVNLFNLISGFELIKNKNIRIQFINRKHNQYNERDEHNKYNIYIKVEFQMHMCHM